MGFKITKPFDLLQWVAAIMLLSFAWLYSAPAAALWMDGQMRAHSGYCSVGGGWYDHAQTYTGYWANGETPKVGEVYYIHVVSATVSPCSNVLKHPVLTLPPNTVPAISAANPIRCFITNIKTNPATSTEVSGLDTNFYCPSTTEGGVTGHGTYSLGWAKQAPGWAWEVLFPVVSSAQMSGMATSSRIVADVQATGDGASLNEWLNVPNQLPSLYAWVTVFGGTSTMSVEYPAPSATNVSTTTARTLATINNLGNAGNVYFDIGSTSAYGEATAGPFPLGAAAYSNAWADWSEMTPGTTYHWRARFKPTTGTEVIGADQVFTTTGGTSSSADLSATVKTDAISVALGKSLTFTLSVKNNGPAIAQNVSLASVGTLPFPIASVVLPNGCSLNGGNLSCSIGTLASGTSKDFVVTGTPAAGGNATLSILASTTTSDPDSTNNSANATVTVVDSNSDLSIRVVDGPSPVVSSDPLSYAIVVTNVGTAAATGVKVEAVLPAAGTPVIKDMPAWCSADTSFKVTCILPAALQPKTSVSFSIVAQIKQYLPNPNSYIASAFSVSASTPDPHTENNSANVVTTINTVPGLAATQGAHVPANATVPKGASNVPLAQAHVSADQTDVFVGSVSILASGTGNDGADVSAVKVYRDANGDGSVDANDTLLASGKLATDNDLVKLTFAQPLQINKGASADLLVVYDFNTVIVGMLLPGGIAFAMLGLAGAVRNRQRRWIVLGCIGVLLVSGVFGGCGGGGSTGAEGGNAKSSVTYSAIVQQIGVTNAGGTAEAVHGVPLQGATISIEK